jgi:hypothetical protein
MARCNICGLYDAQQQECYWFRKRLTDKDIALSDNCTYFINIIYEDGERMTNYQHFLLKKGDIDSKGGKGPIMEKLE